MNRSGTESLTKSKMGNLETNRHKGSIITATRTNIGIWTAGITAEMRVTVN